MDYEKFYEYFKDLYGKGLNITGWHLNGEAEPFDNFFESASEYADVGRGVKDLWDEFGDVPLNPETEEIEVDWYGFPAGTHREDIWHWFEERYNISVASLMYEE